MRDIIRRQRRKSVGTKQTIFASKEKEKIRVQASQYEGDLAINECGVRMNRTNGRGHPGSWVVHTALAR